jgi:hypothetical protein
MMGIDYLIHYDCEPKRAVTLEGLITRLKGRDRAEKIIKLYRVNGDQRSPSHMGFEMVRRTPDGEEETEIVIVQDLLDAAEELKPWEHYCAGCPANSAGRPFGCIGSINYPISISAERWLLNQLPSNDHPLPYILLQKAIREMGYKGESAIGLRSEEEVYMQSLEPLIRDYDGFTVSGNQVFEMLFLSSPIRPAHASLLLQFFGAISPNLEADEIMRLAVPPTQEWIDQNAPFLFKPSAIDDETISDLKAFFKAMYTAWRLSVLLLLDV